MGSDRIGLASEATLHGFGPYRARERGVRTGVDLSTAPKSH